MRNRKTTKQILALLLSMLIVLGNMPVAFAAEDVTEGEGQELQLPPPGDEETGSEPGDEPPGEDLLKDEESEDEGLLEDELSENGMLAFQTMALAADTGPVYYAAEGDLAVAIDQGNYDSTVSIDYPAKSWIEVTLTPEGEDATSLQLDFRTSNNARSDQTPTGALFLDGLGAGSYSITIPGTIKATDGVPAAPTTCSLGTLVVYDPSSSAFLALGGTSQNNGATRFNTNQDAFYWLSDFFERGEIYSGYSLDSYNYYQHADGNVYLTLVAANTEPKDISLSVDGEDISATVIPVGGSGNTCIYLLQFAPPTASSEGSNSNDFTVTDGTSSISVTLRKNTNLRYWLDISEIDQLKLRIVPIGAATPPDKLTIKLFDQYYSNPDAKEIHSWDNIDYDDGAYSVELRNSDYMFGDDGNQSPLIALYVDSSANPQHSVYVSR